MQIKHQSVVYMIKAILRSTNKKLYMLRKYQKYTLQNKNHLVHLKFKSHFHRLLLSRRLDTV